MHYNNRISKQPGGDNGYREARGRWLRGRADAKSAVRYIQATVIL